MQSIKAMILISGSGTNMQNLILSCHKKSIFEIMQNYKLESNLQDFLHKDSKDSIESKNNIDFLKKTNIEFIEVLSNKPEAKGLQKAQNLNIPTKIIESKGKKRKEFDAILSQHLNDLESKSDLKFVLLAGFMRILNPSFFLNLSKNLILLNIHPSFLPLHKGAHGILDSFNDTNDFGGVSVHYVSEILDSGAIILQEKLPKIKGENLESFEARIHKLEYEIYPKAFVKAILDSINL
ncbi:phosphoribosylglycinamide formyltransferase [Helicobacter saguini]|uniref:phosphoribosylglycinamide formyltransferase 1 n=1 Tax=Helicobacter saguini TaxID=1548018 RepID=A0A347VQG3_9HELI|nr:formyltransferase family protein [Helicobacter saguini]MWV60953.1 phosphoribosylglycinamide formyltransferase [Helicobacter saguini]MWV68379.1 phosphoribosylglycinamide formyltransferase [Helicobacter saguini]MWV70157.1 phosphoribosylglycinamide formyltransferase [Helicobacter saguini]MWV72060.1 phosphoribosylglycinamide formyltransferase [Helicobacter saguini]TLD93716.1 phosphoribosylglycinamide formyltransferase [Helicobacter saguini]